MNKLLSEKKIYNYLIYQNILNKFSNYKYLFISHSNIIDTKQAQILYSLLKKNYISIYKIKLNVLKSRFFDKKLNFLLSSSNVIICFNKHFIENILFLNQFKDFLPLIYINKNNFINYQYVNIFLMNMKIRKIKKDSLYNYIFVNSLSSLNKKFFFVLFYPAFKLFQQIKK